MYWPLIPGSQKVEGGFVLLKLAGLITGVLFITIFFSALMPLVCRKSNERLAPAILLLSLFAGLFLLFQTCIYHDALWTYGYMRSALMDHDLSFYNEFVLYNNYFMYVPHPHEPVFYCGAAILMAPFFEIGHLLAQIMNIQQFVPLNGYSWPYTLATSLSGVVAGSVSLFLVYRINRMFFRVVPSLMAAFLVFWAGNLCFYTFVWPLYSHAFSVLSIAAFLIVWFRVRSDSPSSVWLLWGLVLGLATWIRPQNVLFAIIPVCEWLGFSHPGRLRPLKTKESAALFLVGAVLAFSPQMLLWLKTAGKPLLDVYGHIGDDFYWLNPRLQYLFFSTNRGFLLWSPVFILAIPGLITLLKSSYRRKMIILLISFLLQVYLISCYEFPEGGAGFGSRYLINCMPFLALCIAAFFSGISRKYLILFGIVGITLIYANMGLLFAYQLETIPHNNAFYSPQELFRCAFLEGPENISKYVASTRINENVFARNILVDGPEFPAKMLWYVLYLVSCLSLTLIVLFAVFATERWRYAVKAGLAFGVVSLFGAGIYILTLDRGPEYLNIWPALKVALERQEAPPAVFEREIEISAKHPEKNILLNYEKPINIVDLTSTLVFGFEIPPLKTLACMALTDEEGRIYVFNIVNDEDTAEYGAFNIGAAKRIYDCSIDHSAIVHQWLKKDKAGYFYGTGYHRRYTLPRAVRICRAELKYLARKGKLIITGLTFSREKGR